MAALDRILGLDRARRVLEVGAGSGLHLTWLVRNRPGLTYQGFDLSVGMLRIARGRRPAGGSWGLGAGDAMALPCRRGAFDAGFAVDVVHHVPDPVRMLREMAEAVAPGGAVAVLEPNWVFPVNLIYLARPVEWGVFRSRVGNLVRWAREAGWSEVQPVRLPIYFPPFPESLFPAYDWFEAGPGMLAPLRYFSTTLGVRGRAPERGARSTPGPSGSSEGA